MLIAEDDQDTRDALARLVRAEPTLELADAVADAAQAIMVAMREKPAVALLDVHIPGGGATRGARHQAPLAEDAGPRALRATTTARRCSRCSRPAPTDIS